MLVCFKPVRRASEANIAQGFSDLVNRHVLRKVVKHRVAGVSEAVDVLFREQLFGDACFSRSASTYNNADLPLLALNGYGSSELLFHFCVVQGEAADDALRPETEWTLPLNYNVKTRH